MQNRHLQTRMAAALIWNADFHNSLNNILLPLTHNHIVNFVNALGALWRRPLGNNRHQSLIMINILIVFIFANINYDTYVRIFVHKCLKCHMWYITFQIKLHIHTLSYSPYTVWCEGCALILHYLILLYIAYTKLFSILHPSNL